MNSYKGRIKYDDREWLVVDRVELDGKKYYYIIEDISEEIENIENFDDFEGNITLEFIYKVDNGNYRNVTDEALFDTLSAMVGMKALTSEE